MYDTLETFEGIGILEDEGTQDFAIDAAVWGDYCGSELPGDLRSDGLIALVETMDQRVRVDIALSAQFQQQLTNERFAAGDIACNSKGMRHRSKLSENSKYGTLVCGEARK